MNEDTMGNGFRAACASALIGLCGCGDAAPGDAAPGDAAPGDVAPGDAAPGDVTPDAGGLTIELYNRFPYILGDTENASFVLVQNGDGDWAEIEGDHGIYRAPLSSERYGLAIGCLSTSRSSVRVIQQAAADGLMVRQPSCHEPSLQLGVTIQNAPGDTVTSAAVRGATEAVSGSGTFFVKADPGPTELIFSLSHFSLVEFVDDHLIKAVRIPSFDLRASQDFTIDFGTQGVPFEDHPLSVTLEPGEVGGVITSLVTDTGRYRLSYAMQLAADPAARIFQILPASQRKADDLFELQVFANANPMNPTPDSVYLERSASVQIKTPQSLAIELPPAITYPTPTLMDTPYLRPVLSFVNQTQGKPRAAIKMSADSGQTSDYHALRSFSVVLSSSWLGTATSVGYVFPDLSVVSGFADNYALLPRTRINWYTGSSDQNELQGDGSITTTTSTQGFTGQYCGDGVVQPPEDCDPGLFSSDSMCSATCTKQ